MRTSRNLFMKDVSQYPVKHPFGATYAPWSRNKPHLGVDRPTPMRTPVIVNGQLIGFTGDTGGVDPHHHLQRVRDGKVIDPKNDGFILPSPVTVIDAGEPTGSEQPAIGKHIRLRDGHGEEWSHFHLDEIKVSKGQTIGAAMTSPTRRKLTPQECVGFFENFAGRTDVKPTDAVCQNRYVDLESDEFTWGLIQHVRDRRIGAEDRARVAEEKLKEYQKYDKFIESFKEVTR